jgi:hypothetical protein
MNFPALTTSVEIAVTIRKTIDSIWLRKVMAAVTFVIVFDMKVVKHLTLNNLIQKVTVSRHF